MPGLPRPRTPAELVTVCADPDTQVHLAASTHSRTLCGRLAVGRPRSGEFRARGCPRCLANALAGLGTVARDGEDSWINLGLLAGADGPSTEPL